MKIQSMRMLDHSRDYIRAGYHEGMTFLYSQGYNFTDDSIHMSNGERTAVYNKIAGYWIFMQQ